MYWACENQTFNTMPTERFQQHPLVFATNITHCRFFLWRLHLAPPSHPGQSTTLLWLERQSSKCAKLHTVATIDNTMKILRHSHFICAYLRHIGVVHHAHPVRGESHIQHNSKWEAARLAERLGYTFWNDWGWKRQVKCTLRKLRYK